MHFLSPALVGLEPVSLGLEPKTLLENHQGTHTQEKKTHTHARTLVNMVNCTSPLNLLYSKNMLAVFFSCSASSLVRGEGPLC